MTTKLINKMRTINDEKYGFKSDAYKLESGYWSKIEKLMILDNQFDGYPLESITKLKIKGEKGAENNYIVKITIKQKDYFYSMSPQMQIQWLIHLVWGKLYHLINLNPKQEDFSNICEGEIYKKSYIKGNWNKRFVMITKEGLISSQNQRQSPNLHIDNVKQIWTRFQLIQKKSYMVFKMRHKLTKYQFGVPVEHVLKWCRAFYSLIYFD